VTQIREYLRPVSVDEAVAAKNERGDAARYLAGGTDVLVIKPSDVTTVIDVIHLGLDAVEQDNGSITIGSTALLRDIERHPAIVRVANGVLTDALRETGPWLIRNQATLIGNVCNASPSADSAPMLLALDAEVRLSDGKLIPLDQFFVAPHRTVLRNELVVELRIFPRDREASYTKLARSHSDIALADVAVAARREQGKLHDVRIALGSVAPTPVRARQCEQLLEGQHITDELLNEVTTLVRTEIKPIDDWRTSAEYRSHAVGVLVRRALIKLAGAA
jgi:carbon-monoxide dehydrogenase medium subunit